MVKLTDEYVKDLRSAWGNGNMRDLCDDLLEARAQLAEAQQELSKAMELISPYFEKVTLCDEIKRLQSIEDQLDDIRRAMMGDTQCSNLLPYIQGIIQREQEFENERDRAVAALRETEELLLWAEKGWHRIEPGYTETVVYRLEACQRSETEIRGSSILDALRKAKEGAALGQQAEGGSEE